MATGLIASPATWLLGTVHPPSWDQNVQDNVNQILSNFTAYQSGTTTIAVGAAAGSTGSAAAATPSGLRDQASQFTVTPSGTGIGSGVIATITFANATAYPTTLVNGPNILLAPTNAAAAALSGNTQVWAKSVIVGGYYTGFTVNVSAALTGSTVYWWSYFVIAS